MADNPAPAPHFLSRPGGPVAAAAVLLLAIAALALRLYGLHAIGIGGNDTILYFTLAEQWLAGDTSFSVGGSTPVFRPVLLAFNALALWAFGQGDTAIKLATVWLDTANLLLFAALAWRLSRDRAVVVASAASYALLPLAIWAARQELPHTCSTFFVLAACLLFSLAINVTATTATAARPRLWLLVLAGAMVAAAALTHEELILLFVPLALCAWLSTAGAAGAPRWRARAIAVGALLLAPLAAALLVLAFNGDAVLRVLARAWGALGDGSGLAPERLARFQWDAVVGSHSALLALLVLLSLAYLLVRWRHLERGLRAAAAICLLTPILFTAVFTGLFDTLFPRGFLPLLPLLLLGVLLCLRSLLDRVNRLATGGILAVLVAALALSALASFSAMNVGHRSFSQTWAEPRWPLPGQLARGYREFLVDARYTPGYISHWGAVYRALAGSVNGDNRLLVLPSTVIYGPGRRPLQTRAYFGDNAIYRLDHSDVPLPVLVQRYRVKWVLFSIGQLRKPPRRLAPYRYHGRWGESRPLDLAAAYGMAQYSVEGEFRQLLEFLARAGAKEVAPFPAGSYEAQRTRLWYLP